MYTQAVDLKEFYDSVLGRVVQRILRQHIRAFWPETRGLRVAGLGYAVPFMRPMMGEAERLIALMPRQQGAVFWPGEGKGLVTLCDEAELPLETNSVDRLLVVHGLLGYESHDAILREAWRVLTGQGSLVLIVPNRTGLWARADKTPFGHGAPYSTGQIRAVLREYMFVPERSERALFFPPTASRLTLAAAPVWEKMGRRFFNAFGGVNIIEAGKQLYAGTMAEAPVTNGLKARRRLIPTPSLLPERNA